MNTLKDVEMYIEKTKKLPSNMILRVIRFLSYVSGLTYCIICFV